MPNVKKTTDRVSDYTEKYRPQFHFTPEENWMNDPNGLVYYEGEYHLFYQHHPNGRKWGPMHWGHAVSNDLLRWEHLPIALEPDEYGMIFSGSVVVDWENTSGLFAGSEGLVAIFTHHDEQLGVQSQSLAYSRDKGRTWQKYDGNPVLTNGEEKDFRDPKVFWHDDTNKWVMVVAAGQKVMLYGSKNLIQWDFLSEFGSTDGAHGGVWECPDLFPLPVDKNHEKKKWVLQVDLGAGAIAGGSGGQYFIGEFDGGAFTNDRPPSETLWVDYGRDFYAAQSFSDLPSADGRRIWLAWMSDWTYANELPTNPWRSAMSIPREVKLSEMANGDITLMQKPIAELRTLRQSKLVIENEMVDETVNVLANQAENVFEIVATVENLTASEFGFNVRKSSAHDQGTIIGYRTNDQQVFVDREHSGESEFHQTFKGRHSVQVKGETGCVTFHIFVDKSSVELFLNDGEVVITDLIFPEDDSKAMEFYVKGGEVRLVSLELYALQSTWEHVTGRK